MNSVEQLLNLDYDILKQYILNQEPFMLEALKDIRVKEKIINTIDDWSLVVLLGELSDEYFDQLFDEKGIEMIINQPTIFLVLVMHPDFINKIFVNHEFCEIFDSNIDEWCSQLSGINKNTALYLIEYIQENNPKNLRKLVFNLPDKIQKEISQEIDLPLPSKSELEKQREEKELKEIGKIRTESEDILQSLIRLNENEQIEMLKKINLPINILNDYDYIQRLKPKTVEYIINHDYRITTLKKCSYKTLYYIFSQGCCIKSSFLQDKDFIKKIASINSVKDYRFLINELVKANDITEIERARKEFYTSELLSYNSELKMLERYSHCYEELCHIMDNNNYYKVKDKAKEIIDKYISSFGDATTTFYDKDRILDQIYTRDKEKLKSYFQKESNLQMSNMIIDYHFEDLPYNFFLDVEQLCNFQQAEGRTLTDEDLSIYQRLLNIDKLLYEEKLLLHQELSNNNWINKHYDVFRETKNKAAKLIKEKMLDDKKLGAFYNSQLTIETGVPVYELNGQEFFALVKMLRKKKEDGPLTVDDIFYPVGESSFSLDGSGKLCTFYDPHAHYGLIYGDFEENQIIHMFSVDSFSRFDGTFKPKSTPQVNQLLTPTELIENSSLFNEIIIAQKNHTKKDDELNEKLKNPPILGLYCYDEITENDIESAKNLGIGIVVIITKKYDIKGEHGLTIDESLSGAFTYFKDLKKDDMTHRRNK